MADKRKEGNSEDDKRTEKGFPRKTNQTSEGRNSNFPVAKGRDKAFGMEHDRWSP